MSNKSAKKNNVTKFPVKKVNEDYKEGVEVEKNKVKEFNIHVVDGQWSVKPKGEWNIDEIYNMLKDVTEVYSNKRLKILCESLVVNTLVALNGNGKEVEENIEGGVDE